MKCKRCGADMIREKQAGHSYSYRCPKCNLQIRRNKNQTDAGRAEN